MNISIRNLLRGFEGHLRFIRPEKKAVAWGRQTNGNSIVRRSSKTHFARKPQVNICFEILFKFYSFCKKYSCVFHLPECRFHYQMITIYLGHRQTQPNIVTYNTSCSSPSSHFHQAVMMTSPKCMSEIFSSGTKNPKPLTPKIVESKCCWNERLLLFVA